MKQINTNNPFFQNNSFLKDIYKFSLIGHNLGLDETQIYSDEASYIFVLGKNHKPIWVGQLIILQKKKLLRLKIV